MYGGSLCLNELTLALCGFFGLSFPFFIFCFLVQARLRSTTHWTCRPRRAPNEQHTKKNEEWTSKARLAEPVPFFIFCFRTRLRSRTSGKNEDGMAAGTV